VRSVILKNLGSGTKIIMTLDSVCQLGLISIYFILDLLSKNRVASFGDNFAFRCPRCGRLFPAEGALNEHLWIHQDNEWV